MNRLASGIADGSLNPIRPYFEEISQHRLRSLWPVISSEYVDRQRFNMVSGYPALLRKTGNDRLRKLNRRHELSAHLCVTTRQLSCELLGVDMRPSCTCRI